MKTLFTKTTILAAGCVIAVGLVAGCANKDKTATIGSDGSSAPRTSYTEEAESQAISRAAAREADAHRFTEIRFEQGSAALTVGAMENLRNTLLTSNSEGNLDEVIVMAWSDEELPAANAQTLPKAQRDLAKERARSIERFVKQIKSVDVDTYNMAEKSGAVAKLFNTRDSRLKKTLVAAGLPTTADSLQYPSKASHAVVMVKIDE